MADIIEEVMKFIPDKNKISDSYFEGANIVLYTKDKDFFLDNNGIIIFVSSLFVKTFFTPSLVIVNTSIASPVAASLCIAAFIALTLNFTPSWIVNPSLYKVSKTPHA